MKGDDNLSSGKVIAGHKMMAVRELSDMRSVCACPVFFPLKTQDFLTLLYKETSICTNVPFFIAYVNTNSTHIIIIISTKVQYSIVSVLVQFKSVI